MSKVIVFGGAGFVGSNLTAQLVKDGHEVVVFDNFSTSKKENLSGINADIIEGDIRDVDAVNKAIAGKEIVFHTAALIGSVRSAKNPVEVCEVNSTGTVNVLEAARLNNIKKFIFISTCEVYSSPPQYIPMDEKHPTDPISIYGTSLLAAEKHCMAYNSLYGLNIGIIRFFTMYGYNQEIGQFGGAITNFLYNALKKDQAPSIWGQGNQKRDFIFIEDAVKILIQAMKASFSGIYNCGSGTEISLKELANLVLKICDKSNLEITFKEAKPGDIPRMVSNNRRLESALGSLKFTSLEEGIGKYKAWMDKNL